MEFKLLVGAESKAFLSDLENAIKRMETIADKLMNFNAGESATPPKSGKKTAPAASFDEEAEEGGEAGEAETEDQDDMPVPVKKGKKSKAVSFDDDAEEEEAPPLPAKKAAKAPKLTLDDVNNAAMDRSGRTNRAEVIGLMKKHFKIKSVTDLDPTDYEAFIKLMKSG